MISFKEAMALLASCERVLERDDDGTVYVSWFKAGARVGDGKYEYAVTVNETKFTDARARALSNTGKLRRNP